MNEQANIALVQQCYAAYTSGNIEQLLSRFTDDIEWELPEVPTLAFTGKRQGNRQVAEFFQQWSEKLAVRQFEPRDFIAQGDKVVALGHSEWTTKDTGMDFDSDWVHVFTIRDGKVASFREFMDAQFATEAFQCYPMQTPRVRPAAMLS